MADFSLKFLLNLIAKSDPSRDENLPESQYLTRNRFVVRAVSEAQRIGLSAGFSVDPNPDIPEFNIVAWIELPTGYVGWHLPALPDRWDGSSTEEKYNRISKFMGRKP